MKAVGVGRCLGGVLAVGLAMAATELRAEDEAAPATNLEFRVTLTDSSSIVCQTKLVAFPLRTSFGEVKLPLRNIESIRFDHKANSIAVAFLNGDRIQGGHLLETLSATCLLGEVKIPLAIVAEIASTVKKQPVFEDSPAKRNACINNLRMIDAAKEQWALASGVANGAVNEKEANDYIKGGAPVCPAGGSYSYNELGVEPECSVPGHALR